MDSAYTKHKYEIERSNDTIQRCDSHSTSLHSFLTYASYMETNSIDTLCVQINDDDRSGDEVSIADDKPPMGFDIKYYDYNEQRHEGPIMKLSPVQSPDYKNYSLQEMILFSYNKGWCWHNSIGQRWRHNLTIWLLQLIQDSSYENLRYDFVERKIKNTFGVTAPGLAHWIEKEIPHIKVVKSAYDGELYVISIINVQSARDFLGKEVRI